MAPRHTPNARLRRRHGLFATIAIGGLLVGSIGSVEAATVTVASVNFEFQPASRAVQVGDTVRWTFAGDPHTVTSGTPGAPDGRFESGIEDPGGSFQVTFDQAGTFPYFCQIHSEQMTGTIVVTAATATQRPTPRPTATPTPRPTPRPTAAPTPRPTAAPTPRPTATSTPAPSATASPSPPPPATTVAPASASPGPTATTSPTGSSAPDAGGSPSTSPGLAPAPGEPAAGVGPVPIVVVVGLLAAIGLVLARRSRRAA